MYNCCQQPIISPFTSGALKSIPRSLTNAFIFQTKPPHRERVGTLGFQLQQSNRSHSARHNISHYTHLSAIITTVIGPPDLARPPPGWYIITPHPTLPLFFSETPTGKAGKAESAEDRVRSKSLCLFVIPFPSQSRSHWLRFWFPALNCFMQPSLSTHTHKHSAITETGSSSNHNPARGAEPVASDIGPSQQQQQHSRLFVGWKDRACYEENLWEIQMFSRLGFQSKMDNENLSNNNSYINF